MADYKFSVEIQGGFTPKNEGKFPLINSPDILIPDGNRLADAFEMVSADEMTEIFNDSNLTFIYVGDLEAGAGIKEVDYETMQTWGREWISATVVWDGISYTCLPQYNGDIKFVGNGAYIGKEESDFPFCVQFAIIGDIGYIFCRCYEGERHSLSVSLVFEKAAKLKDEYMQKSYPIQTGATDIRPDIYYTFGEVSELSLNLIPVGDGRAHEYMFEFKAMTNNMKLTILPSCRWVSEPQTEAGKTYQVSILRGIGVIAGA